MIAFEDFRDAVAARVRTRCAVSAAPTPTGGASWHRGPHVASLEQRDEQTATLQLGLVERDSSDHPRTTVRIASDDVVATADVISALLEGP